jgi:NhaA family Na+:H+ antiporter
VGSPVAWGIFVGLVIGKPLGILLASGIAVRLGAGSLPEGVGWIAVAGAGLVAGMGFTVSIFISELALLPPSNEYAKIGILAASVVAGIGGFLVLIRRTSPEIPVST